MAKYMTQTMRSGVLKAILYYRKQSTDHVSHEESEKFTTDAKNDYVTNNPPITLDDVEVGTYRSAQGRPNNNAEEI